MTLAERLIIQARKYWARKGFDCLSNPAQKVLVNKFRKMLMADSFNEGIKEFSKYQVLRQLVKSSRLHTGIMIRDTTVKYLER